MKRYLFLLVMICVLSACGKKELAMSTPAVVKLTIKGYSMGDTLEVIDGSAVIATLRADQGFAEFVQVSVKGEQQQMEIRKKRTKEVLGTIAVDRTPFMQTKRLYYDGKKMDDKIALTPVSKPGYMGIRMQFKTDFPYFYGGPVNITVYKRELNMITYEYTDELVRRLAVLPEVFSDFLELPMVESTDELWRSYIFKVSKAGTDELPYTSEADLSGLYDINNTYGDISNLKEGDSRLYIIGPYYDKKAVGDGYRTDDISAAFK